MGKVLYRAVKANDNNDVIAIGYDENQGGKDYNGVGIWCDFTFEEIPTCSEEINELVKDLTINVLKVENDSIVVKTVEEIEAEIALLETEPEAEAVEE